MVILGWSAHLQKIMRSKMKLRRKTTHTLNFFLFFFCQGVTCPQEAEFRAYDILLNLNEGDILRYAYMKEVPFNP